MKNKELKLIHEGNHLTMVARGTWEFITRNINSPGVGIVAITDAGDVVIVEQYRPPVDCNVFELPAGLSGDVPGAEDEAIIEAAKRELLEETGYSAKQWTKLCDVYSSPGLTDESMVLFLAEGLVREQAGGGDESEEITLHEVPLNHIIQWLNEKNAHIDLKLYAALFAAQQHLQKNKG